MTERPTLFSAPMVRAILDGRKTQTRRVVKPQPFGFWGGTDLRTHTFVGLIEGPKDHCWLCPYGKPGDRLWVRESFSRSARERVIYRASEDEWHQVMKDEGGWVSFPRWTPSIHMPRWASRITLEVTGVRVERLQDITQADCRAEGCSGGHGSIPGYNYNATPREHFRHIWEAINGKDSYLANPWVWVVEFKRVDA